MHWSSKHKILNSLNTEGQRSYSSKNSTRKTSGARVSNGVRTGSSIGSSKPLEAPSSRNLVTNENHGSVLEPSSTNSKDIDGLRGHYSRAFGRDISNMSEARSFADQITIQPNKYVSKKPTIPHPSMSSRYKSNNAENIRFGGLRSNVSSTDMFHAGQGKKMSIDPPSSDRQRNASSRGGKNQLKKSNLKHSTSDFEKGVNYKCKRSQKMLNRGASLSKNRSNSGARNGSYLKSHQFIRTNNHTGLQSFHSHIQHMSNASGSNKNLNQGRKMSINQMRTVSGLEGNGEAIITVDKPANNYTSFNTNKQSFNNSYAAPNTSGGNIAYNNYSRLTRLDILDL